MDGRERQPLLVAEYAGVALDLGGVKRPGGRATNSESKREWKGTWQEKEMKSGKRSLGKGGKAKDLRKENMVLLWKEAKCLTNAWNQKTIENYSTSADTCLNLLPRCAICAFLKNETYFLAIQHQKIHAENILKPLRWSLWQKPLAPLARLRGSWQFAPKLQRSLKAHRGPHRTGRSA